jgi:hypothetical protein
MNFMTNIELIPVLQMAVGPVALISGVGLLILSLTNRLGRVVDRGRILASQLQETPNIKEHHREQQLGIISHRAELLRFSIIFAVISVLLAAVLVVLLFLTASFDFEAAWAAVSVFLCSLTALVVSLIYFLLELNQALVAFRLDIGK